MLYIMFNQQNFKTKFWASKTKNGFWHNDRKERHKSLIIIIISFNQNIWKI